MSWISGWFGVAEKFRLPKPGEKVGYSDKVLKDFPHIKGNKCFMVTSAKGNELSNTVRLHCGTVLHEGQWKILPKETEIRV